MSWWILLVIAFAGVVVFEARIRRGGARTWMRGVNAKHVGAPAMVIGGLLWLLGGIGYLVEAMVLFVVQMVAFRFFPPIPR